MGSPLGKQRDEEAYHRPSLGSPFKTTSWSQVHTVSSAKKAVSTIETYSKQDRKSIGSKRSTKSKKSVKAPIKKEPTKAQMLEMLRGQLAEGESIMTPEFEGSPDVEHEES